ncbi:MAG TPA: hypothetical protein VF898_13085 [Chloroflexota bacterium]
MTAERDAAPPAVEVLEQDDGSQLRVKPVLHGPTRLIDVRIWRIGPTGLAPARAGLILDESDMHALHHGLAELIEASHGGRQVARVVWDGIDGRRLRAETEPFGTRHLARLGFWQRVRNSWRPADDGLVFQADRLLQLQNALGRFRHWMRAQPSHSGMDAILPTGSILDRWPASGADWLTLEPERVAFHPRGIRITCSIGERDGRHWLVVRQWQREDTLWLPDTSSVDLSIADLELVLKALLRLFGRLGDEVTPAPEHCSCSNGSEIRVWPANQAGKEIVCLEQFRPNAEEPAARLSFSVDDLPRFGRALVQGWYMLAGWLSEGERSELRHTVRPRPEFAPSQPTEEIPVVEPISRQPVDEPAPAKHQEDAPEPRIELPALSFAAESSSPGMLIPGNGTVRIEVTGSSGSEAVTLPVEVAGGVLPELAELERTRGLQQRPDPVLLFEQPDCAVFGRLGTWAGEDVVELRVWTAPSESEAIAFTAARLPDLIDSLQRYLEMSGAIVSATQEWGLTGPPASIVDAAHPAQLRPLAARLPLEGPARGLEVTSTDTLNRPMGEITLGEAEVSLRLLGREESPVLSVSWEDGSLELAVSHLQQLLDDLRALYYDALRGRRGHGVTVCQYPLVTVSVENKNGDLSAVLRQEVDGEFTSLWFPARQVPGFLDAAGAALSQT